MIPAELEKALESRKVLRVQKNGLDATLYDTGQILVFGNVTREKYYSEGNKRVSEDIEVPARFTYDLRTAASSYSIGNSAGSGWSHPPYVDPLISKALELLKQRGADLSKWRTPSYEERTDTRRYPKLADFIDEIHNAFADHIWVRHELAITGFLPTLAGHGNMPPATLLNPKVILGYIYGTVFPFERQDIFNFGKGRKNLEGRTEYMDSDEGVSYNGNAVLIRPWHLTQENKSHTVVEAHFFNPANYQRFLNGELKVENPLPSRRDWKFEVTYGIEDGRKWLHFSADRFDYQHVQKEGLLDQKKNDIYLKTDDSLVNTIEKIAPLPI